VAELADAGDLKSPAAEAASRFDPGRPYSSNALGEKRFRAPGVSWLDLHANVTRNHRCRTMEELMVQVVAFLRAYNQRKKLNPSLKLAAGVSGSRSVV
jgi:hypothetical protein